jgi:hypothetical protein
VAGEGQASSTKDGCNRLKMVVSMDCCVSNLPYTWRPPDVESVAEPVISTSESLGKSLVHGPSNCVVENGDYEGVEES